MIKYNQAKQYAKNLKWAKEFYILCKHAEIDFANTPHENIITHIYHAEKDSVFSKYQNVSFELSIETGLKLGSNPIPTERVHSELINCILDIQERKKKLKRAKKISPKPHILTNFNGVGRRMQLSLISGFKVRHYV